MKNAYLLFKWWWRFSQEKQALWLKVIKSIHNESCNFSSPRSIVPKVRRTWSDIIKMGLEGSIEKQIFFKELQIEIGNGATTQFWVDHWLGDAPLKVLFPILYE